MTIKRYDESCCGPSNMFEAANGDWCHWDEVEPLIGTPAERRFLAVVAEHGLAHGVGECQDAWGAVVEERELRVMTGSAPVEPRCKRCGSSAPPWSPDRYNAPSGRSRGDAAALLAANPTLREPEGSVTCAFCIGLAMRDIIDMAWKLDGIPTDALMREIARRFL